MHFRFTHGGLVAVISLAVCITALSVDGEAAIFDLTAVINGAQANRGNGSGSPATGNATVQLDDSNNRLSWDIQWSGLTSPATVMHFHGPASPTQNAGVQVDFGDISGTISPSIGAAIITPTQATDLLNDLWYINIHTQQFPGGEIRGQVLLVPEPAGWGLMVVVLSLWMASRRRRMHR